MSPSSHKLEWLDEDVTAKGVRQRRFDLHRNGRVAPGLLLTPEGQTGDRPLVLVGHGAGNHKSGPYVLSFGRRVVRHPSFAAVMIDGPVHGDRRADGSEDGALMFADFAAMWASDPQMTNEMVDDWRATLDGVQELEDVGTGPVGYWGLSMGTIFGIPLVAAERRIEVAVLGLMGTSGPHPEVQASFLSAARSITCPVLFLLQWDDELMRRDRVLELFGEIGSTDKRMHANLGGHVELPLDEFESTERFLAERLTNP